MSIQIGDDIYIVETTGTETYLMKGSVEKINSNTLIFQPLQVEYDRAIKQLPREYYPKQKNITITKSLDDAKLIYLAKKLKKVKSIDEINIKNIKEEFGLNDLSQEIERSKSLFPEYWF